MPLINSFSPNGAVGGPLPNSQPQALAIANGAAAASAAARLLLPSAVVQSAVVPAYAPEPRLTKPVVRTGVAPASSALAAQFIAQTPEATDDELAIFARREPPASAQPSPQDAPDTGDDFLAQLRQSYGSAPSAPPAPANPVAVARVAVAPANALAANAANIPALATLTPKSMPTAEARMQTFIASPGGKKAGIVQSRGSSAYALTANRGASTTVVPSVLDAVS